MGFEIHRGFFDSLEEVLEDVKKTGYWPTTLVSPASPELPLHWHDADVNGYLMQGSTYLLDEHGTRLPFEKGDKLILPKGALHAGWSPTRWSPSTCTLWMPPRTASRWR